MKIVVAMEQDFEVTRHHISMATPLGQVYQWRPSISAYDMFDTVKPDLVMCSHQTFYGDKGLNDYVYKYGTKCLVRYEAEGDILADNVITYTRYKDQFKEHLPSCADVTKYSKVKMKKKIDTISIKNYVSDDFLSSPFDRKCLEKSKNNGKRARFKVFRAYNVKTEWHCGDLSDEMLSDYVNMSKCGLSVFRPDEACVTSDVFNMLHCGISVDVICSDKQEEFFFEDFKDYSISSIATVLYPESLPKNYTNIDRAKKIAKLFGLKYVK